MARTIVRVMAGGLFEALAKALAIALSSLFSGMVLLLLLRAKGV